mmetsp:Transcript_539/g.985  ORF Transcript_539/g.985 Transcript_539/m.985 type:complete len:203 (-) Transcript_539:16-624(-)
MPEQTCTLAMLWQQLPPVVDTLQRVDLVSTLICSVQPPTHMPVSFVKNKNFASNSSCLLSKNKITKQPWPCMLNNNSSSNKGHSMVVDKISNRQLPCSIPTVAHLIITIWWTEAMANSSKIRHWNLSLRQQQRRDMEMVDIKRKCSDKPLILVVAEVGSFEVHENTHRRRWADGGYMLRTDEVNNVNEKRFAYGLMVYKIFM